MVFKTSVALLSLASASQAWPWGRAGKWSDAQLTTCHGQESYINYTTITGFFEQDDPVTDPETYDYATSNYGLIDRSYPTDAEFDPEGEKTLWQRFEYYVNTLNRDAGKNEQYKVLLMARHGEGYHNAAESYFGKAAWNCYWGPLEGNETTTWRDAALTEDGIEQTVKAFNFWTEQLSSSVQMPAPQSYYSSPMQRCFTTANLTFNGLPLPEDRPFLPTIKEFLREGISIRTCDERSNKTWISSQVPFFRFEQGFTEFDELWRGDEGETSEAQLARTKEVIDDIFASDDAAWISITSHSGQIRENLEVLGHREFSLSTGQAIPALVRAVNVRKDSQIPESSTYVSFTAEATCANGPPITSIDGQGCVCSSATPTPSSGSSGVPTVSATPTPTPMRF